MPTDPDEPGLALAELLREVARDEDGAFERLYDSTSSRVFGLVVRTVRDRRLSEDVVQEVYLQIWQQSSDFDPARGSALAWVLTIAHRRAVDRVRREQGAGRRDQHLASVGPDPAPDPADEVADSDLHARETTAVRRCLDGLTGTQRESIDLAYYDGLTYRQVAAQLEVALPTVKSRIRDGLRRLRDCLDVWVEG